MRIAAIDQGTTSTRVLVVDRTGAAIRHAVRHTQQFPRAGWVEHAPLELLRNVEACLAAAGDVDAVGLANQGESCLAWDAVSGEPLSPVIVWQDNRTAAHVDAMRTDGFEALTLERAGLPLDAYFSASKLGWILAHHEAAARAHRRGRLRLGTTDAFFLERLTGHFATDVATASRTSLMNLRTGEWDDDLCRAFGVPRECLPEIRANVTDFGRIGATPLTASIVDQQAALYGHGCRAAGDAKVTFGTGAFVLALTGATVVDARAHGLLPTVAWQLDGKRTYALDGGVYDASSAVEWARRLGLFVDMSDIGSFARPPAISRGLAFVPALSGLACPHWDRSAAALWIGMDASTTRTDLCQAVLEGVALRAAEVLVAMESHVTADARLSLDGGMAKNRYFAQFFADVAGRELVAREFDELTAYGCAALAARGLSAELPPLEAAATCYAPRANHAQRQLWRDRFASAVQRTRSWRPAHAGLPDQTGE